LSAGAARFIFGGASARGDCASGGTGAAVGSATAALGASAGAAFFSSAPLTDVSAALRSALREQLYKPVRWAQTIQSIAGQGVNTFFECGPGKVLAGLNKRILDKTAVSIALEEPAGIDQAFQKIKEPS